ncbi:DUF4124 domain-containing protein [Methyloversatilis universalis]|uniref:DUF4124 domain-containing protein n=1 Tax=Methyloversatilis universalis TaxID=378211 RepID=UPI00037634ED|nr:DUF4124 domain-containing protein [Methyloversatilis universalis]
MKLHRLICIVLAGALCAGTAIAQTYKWKDAQGRTHYTDTPPPPDARSATEKKLQPSVVEQGASYAEREAMKNAPVTVWFGNECDKLCESAQALLRERAIAYTEQRITSEEQKAALVARFKVKEARVPAIAAGADQLMGYSADAWNRLLDRAGYPAKGSAKPPAPKPAAAEPTDGAAKQ